MSSDGRLVWKVLGLPSDFRREVLTRHCPRLTKDPSSSIFTLFILILLIEFLILYQIILYVL